MDFNHQADPALLLLKNCTSTQNLEILLQARVGDVVQAWSNGATNSIKNGDAYLTTLAAGLSAYTGDSSQMSEYASQYQVAQTEVSNVNNQYSNVMQGGGTALTNLTDVEAQNLQFCQTTTDNQQNVNQLIMAWGG